MILLALLLFAGAGLLLAWAEDHAHRTARAPLALAWFDRFLLPLGRVVALLLFIVCAYPALYGLRARDVPGFLELLSAQPGRLDRLINLLFFVGLILPAIPSLGRRLAFVLPVQGMAGVALVATWLSTAQGLPLSPWPGMGNLVLLLAGAALAALAARFAITMIEQPVLRQDVYDLLVLWLQAPLLLLYGRMLAAPG
ncbi:MAG TPA: hypothetical protein VGE57_03970 [Solimonas sp.]